MSGTCAMTCPNFYPRSPRGERPEAKDDMMAKLEISIHAPREGSDRLGLDTENLREIFLSTLPARGATVPHVVYGFI